MPSEVFIISAARGTDASQAICQAVEAAGVRPSRVQDVVFQHGLEATVADPAQTTRAAGLSCPSVSVSGSLRAILFAAQSILSGDVEVSVVAAAEREAGSALVLAGPEAVGRWNLMPRARLAARSLAGPEAALRTAGIAAGEVSVSKHGDRLSLIARVLDELEGGAAKWAMVTEGDLALLLESSQAIEIGTGRADNATGSTS
jgi:hypothetical protein